MTETLQADCLPLWGSRLIEASAGTGKTWTIAALYLRLVLGHGGENAYTRPLSPSQILVMTFTRAATRELSDRIRSRLLEAARCFRGEKPVPDGDTFLAALLDACPDDAARRAAAWRLAMAAESMDEASVHTIDAWCQRMLREHAFDSGCLFDEELSANEGAMRLEATHDYWRQQVYPLAGAALDEVLAVWGHVDKLADEAGQLLDEELPADAGEGSLGELLTRVRSERAGALAALKDGWVERTTQMRDWLAMQLALKNCPYDKRSLAPRNTSNWLDALAAWAGDPAAETLDMKTGRTRFTPQGMKDALKPGETVDLPPIFEQFEALMLALEALPPLASSLRLHAAARIAERLAELKQQAGSFGFADMLNRLDRALDAGLNGEHAQRLRARILTQYPVALIDEFQDTSPMQSRIFDRLYRIADNDPATALLLIGDPKQSIYGFRGADIHSYLTARRATEGRHYLLGTNHRSTAALVAAVNHLFSQAEAQAAGGAFMFRADGENALPFVEVQARCRAETFVTSSGARPALTLEIDERLLDISRSRRLFAARCAEHIVMLLNDAGAGFAHPEGRFERLRPADIAVLVRTGTEAAAVRDELRRRQVASVYLSDKDSVFDSDEARDLQHWLRAVASPRDVRLARAALATRTLDFSIAELLELASVDEAFDRRCEQLRQLNAVWLGQGVLSMLRQTLHLLDLPARWLVADGGERRLTNFLHLAELLQAASAQLDGEQALIRWLAGQRGGNAGGGDEQIVRLESDADLVKVVTVHKSKGLEYPLVFLPFASAFRTVNKARTLFVKPADADGSRRLQLQPSSQQIDAADKERQREDLRLLYVAMTRARHALWVGLAALKIGPSALCVWPRSAIGHLLGGAVSAAPGDLAAHIAKLVQPCGNIVLLPAGSLGAAPGETSGRSNEPPSEPPAEQSRRTQLLPRGVPPALRELLPYTASFERRWSVGSYSVLVRALSAAGAWSASTAAVRDDELPAAAAAELSALPLPAIAGPSVPLAGAAPWHRFPRGAMPGNFLHEQLEWLAGEAFALETSAELQQQLMRRCERHGWAARWPDLVDWLSQLLKSPLPPLGAALCDIARPVPELEFWMPSSGLQASAVDALCRQHLLGGRERPALPERELRGMLMGFADLVFEHEGRYWVLDYKSNHLGASDADYDAEALEAAMAEHRYDVQAALYLQALHRLLRARLGANYEPARHLGGAIYHFLRGFRGPAGGCYVVPAEPELLTGLDALMCSAGEGA